MKDQINKYLLEFSSLKTDDLLSKLGQAENGTTEKLNLTTENLEKIIANGYRAYLEAKDAFRKKICESPHVRNSLNNEKILTKSQIAAGLVDLLMAHYNIVSACSIAILIINDNLNDLCGNDKDNTGYFVKPL